MKLPGINYTRQVESLGRHDIDQPLWVAAAQARAARSTESAINSSMQMWLDRRDDMEFRQNTLGVVVDKSNWVRENAKKTEFSPDELPADLEVERTEQIVNEAGVMVEQPRASIPAHEVYPQLYQRMQDSLITTYGEKFHNKNIAERWSTRMKTQAEQSLTQVTLASVEKQKAYSIKQTNGNINRALDAAQYDVAREVLQANYDIPDEIKRQQMEVIREREETDGYNTLLTNLHEDGLRDSLSYLESDEYDGSLEPNETRAYADAIRRALNGIEQGRKQELIVHNNILKFRVRDAISVLESGREISPTRVAELQDEIETVDPVLALKLNRAALLSPTIRGLAFHDSDWRKRAMVESAKNAAEFAANSDEAAAFSMMLDQANDAIDAAIDKDPVSYYMEISGKSLKDLDYENLGESLKERAAMGKTLASMWKIPEVYLTDGEAMDMADKIREGNKIVKMHMAGQIFEALGDESYKLFDQLEIKEVGAFVSAGRAIAENDTNSASIILNGEQFLKENGNILSDIKKDLVRDINSMAGQLYPKNSTRMSQTRNAIMGVYAYLSSGKDVDDIDPDTFDKAVNIVTGGVMTYEDSMIELPRRGMRPKEAERWIESLDPSYITQLGGVRYYTPQQVLDDIHDGEVQIIGTGTKGSYLLIDKEFGLSLFNRNGKPFILKYDEHAPMIPKVKVDPLERFADPEYQRRTIY